MAQHKNVIFYCTKCPEEYDFEWPVAVANKCSCGSSFEFVLFNDDERDEALKIIRGHRDAAS